MWEIGGGMWKTHEAAELLEALEHACDDEGTPISTYIDELGEIVVHSSDFRRPTGFRSLRDVSKPSCVFLLQDLLFDFA